MISSYHFEFLGQDLQLLPQRAIFWKEKKALILADLHLGKATHFQKEGIPVPVGVFEDDLKRLSQIVEHFQATDIYFLGDLFHSVHNEEWELFKDWMKEHDQDFHLILGNHDILREKDYESAAFASLTERFEAPPFVFIHDSEDREEESELYPLAGHVHPSVRISGPRNSLRLPCFYFGKEYGLVPAFGRFTGTALIRPKRPDKVFAIVESKVLQVQ